MASLIIIRKIIKTRVGDQFIPNRVARMSHQIYVSGRGKGNSYSVAKIENWSNHLGQEIDNI